MSENPILQIVFCLFVLVNLVMALLMLNGIGLSAPKGDGRAPAGLYVIAIYKVVLYGFFTAAFAGLFSVGYGIPEQWPFYILLVVFEVILTMALLARRIGALILQVALLVVFIIGNIVLLRSVEWQHSWQRLLHVALIVIDLAMIGYLLLPGVRTAFRSVSGASTAYAGKFLVYEVLFGWAMVMLVPFYWMLVTSFKDGETASAFPPIWTPSRVHTLAPDPETGEMIHVARLGTAREEGEMVRVVPDEAMVFRKVEEQGAFLTRETPIQERIFQADPLSFQTTMAWDLDLKNYMRAWYRPEQTTRGRVSFLTYFLVSIFCSLAATSGALTTSAFSAFAFARLEFFGKTVIFYIILATMMVPGQVLLIPNFLILSGLGMLDTYGALVVPWLASVFTIFLMRQFFMTIPEDLWDAARIDGASRFRYLWQVVVPLSKPVFITAGIFDFLNNWNSLLWPLIVTSTPTKRTLMVGLQNLSDDAGTEFHILMAASCLAVLPIVIAFFFLQRFFIEGIARTGLK